MKRRGGWHPAQRTSANQGGLCKHTACSRSMWVCGARLLPALPGGCPQRRHRLQHPHLLNHPQCFMQATGVPHPQPLLTPAAPCHAPHLLQQVVDEADAHPYGVDLLHGVPQPHIQPRLLGVGPLLLRHGRGPVVTDVLDRLHVVPGAQGGQSGGAGRGQGEWVWCGVSQQQHRGAPHPWSSRRVAHCLGTGQVRQGTMGVWMEGIAPTAAA